MSQTEKEAVPNEAQEHGREQAAAESPLGRALLRVMRALVFEQASEPELEALPLAQLRLIWAIFSLPDSTMKDFSERLTVSQSTVTQLAERLVRRGLIERHTDSLDRRVVRLRLSAIGQHVVDRSNALQRRTHEYVWERLSDEDRDAAMRGMEILAQAGEAFRAAQGRPIPMPYERDGAITNGTGDGEQAQPVVDLMARRVRGRSNG